MAVDLWARNYRQGIRGVGFDRFDSHVIIILLAGLPIKPSTEAMDIGEPGVKALIVALAAAAGAWVLLKLVLWARKGGRGAILAGALFGLGFVADPVFERLLRTVQEAREDQDEKDRSGEP